MTHPEGEPLMRISIGEDEFDATPANTSIFTFIGKLASRDHIFIATHEAEETRQRGAYLFKLILGEDRFNEMGQYMVSGGYPCHLNLPEVAECDEDAYQRVVGQIVEHEAAEIPDELPEDFS